MKRSLTVSASAHLALLVAVLVGLPNPKPFEIDPQDAIQVDISNIGDVTQVKATTKEVVEEKKPPAPEKTETLKEVKPAPKVDDEVIEAAKEKQPEPQPEPDPKPEEKKLEDKPVDPDPLKQLLEDQKLEEEKKAAEEAELAEKKAAEEKKKREAEEKKKAEAEKKKKIAEAKKKAEEEKRKKQKLDVAELEQLLNKENEERTAPKKASNIDGSPDQGEQEVQGDDSAAEATIVDAMRERLKQCWDKPPIVRELGIRVILSWNMNRDGNVVGIPIPVGGDQGEHFQTAAQAATSAVLACQPYDWLPKDKYDLWKEFEWTFAPKDT